MFLGRNPELLAKVRDAAVQGKLTLPVRKTVPLRGVIPAVVELEEKGTPKGKVVITFSLASVRAVSPRTRKKEDPHESIFDRCKRLHRLGVDP